MKRHNLKDRLHPRKHEELAKPAVLFISRRERFFLKMHSVNNTLHSKIYSVNNTLHSKIYSVNNTLHSKIYSVNNTLHSKIYSVNNTLHSKIYSVNNTLHSKIYSVNNTLHSKNLKNHVKLAVVKNTKLKMKRVRYFMAQRKIPWAAIMALVLVVLASTLMANGTFSASSNIRSSGSIQTYTSSGKTFTSSAASSSLGVYSNSACSVLMTSINWGSASLGGTSTQTIYVENKGDVSLTLSLQTSNWSPTSANGPITISWNQQGTTLAPKQSTAAIITLAVSDSATGITSFSVQISISGTG